MKIIDRICIGGYETKLNAQWHKFFDSIYVDKIEVEGEKYKLVFHDDAPEINIDIFQHMCMEILTNRNFMQKADIER